METVSDSGVHWLSVSVPISDLPFAVYNLVDSAGLYHGMDPWMMLLGLGCLTLVVMGGGFLAYRGYTRTLILSARVEEKSRQHQGLEQVNTQLKQQVQQRLNKENLLRENQALLHGTIESVAEGILVVDDRLQVTHFNRRLLAMLDQPEDTHRLLMEDIVQWVIRAVPDPGRVPRRPQRFGPHTGPPVGQTDSVQ